MTIRHLYIHEINETEDGQLFIAMAFYAGETLKEKIAKGPVEINEAISITKQICQGLEKAHQSGIIHRDIKPANIFITKDGTVKILDFGLAKAKGHTQLTKMGTTVGTVSYMSPEQATGSDVDKRTDIWSTGVVFYEMLTGELPFRGDYEQAVIYSIINTEPELDDITQELLPILKRAFSKSSNQRYQSADEMKSDLEALVNHTGSKGHSGSLKLKRIRLRTKVIAAAIIILVLASVSYIIIDNTDNNSAGSSVRKMIVVLPFENLGPPKDEYFAEGMRDEISNKLSSFASIGVISRNSAERCAKSNKSTKEIGKELGVDYILEGTIRWAKNNGDESRIRIIPQLVRVSDDLNIWSDSYDRIINDIFNVQNEIARNVVNKLGIKLLNQSVTGPPPTQNLEAYDYYVKAVQIAYKNSTDADLFTGIRLWEKAIELDPDFAEAYAQLSIAHGVLYSFYIDRNKMNVEKTYNYLKKARELKPEIAIVHLASAFYYELVENDRDSALEEFKRTVEIQPSNAEANFWIGGILTARGDFPEGLKYILKAASLDPLVARYSMDIGNSYFDIRDYHSAEKYYKKTIELSSELSTYRVALARNYLFWKGDTKLAWQTVEKIKDDSYLEYFSNIFIYLSILERNFDKALVQLKSFQKEYSDNAYTGYIPNSQMIGLVYNYMKKPELSKAYLDTSKLELLNKIKKDPEDKRFYAALSVTNAGLGNKTQALLEYEKFIGVKKKTHGINEEKRKLELFIKINILLGDYHKALDGIDSLLAKPTGFSINILKLDPFYDPLRGLPGYKSIVDKYSEDTEL